MFRAPSYDGSGLVNLVAEIERRLTGEAPSPGLSSGLSEAIPEGDTYVLVLFDGLGVSQIAHPGGSTFRSAQAGSLDAPFPTTTSVSLATIATGLPPSQSGQIAHLHWLPDIQLVVNSLKWLKITGEPVEYDYPSFLPRPNLWERLRSAGVEAVTVQPGDFAGSPLSRVLYRGLRQEGIWDEEELVKATVQLASVPNRFVFTYVPHVDFAGHVFGLGGDEFTQALRTATTVWEKLAALLPTDVVLLGTADHGLAEFTEEQKILIRNKTYDELRFAGDSRGVQMWGSEDLMERLAAEVGGSLADPATLIGPHPTEEALSRVGERVLLAPDDLAFIPKGFDKRLRCYHGGLSRAEVEIPLLVG